MVLLSSDELLMSFKQGMKQNEKKNILRDTSEFHSLSYMYHIGPS